MSDPQKPDKTVMERKESTTTAAKAVSEKSTKRSFWSKKHAVYATGFPFTARSDEIKNFFYSCTDFKNLKKQIDDTKRWSGAVVVFFKSEKGVEDALQLNKELWHGTGEDGEHKELCLKIKSFRLDEETYVTMRNPSTPEKREREEKRKEVKKAAKKEKLNLKRKRDQEKKDAIPKGFKGGKSSDKKDKKFKKSKPSSK